MVYLEKSNIKGKIYYKLVHALRKGEKITHKKKYIGKTLPSKERLEQLKKEFMKEITGQKYKYLTSKDVEDIEEKKEEYQKERKRLSPLELEKALEEFIVRFTYDSSKLAGVDVTLRQTSLILKEGIIPKGFKNVKTIKEIENHEKCVLVITKYKGVLNLKFIKKLHAILMSGVDDSIAGKLRSELHKNVRLTGTSYVPPPWTQLQRELNNFFSWYKAENRKLHPLELAALIHLKLVSLQPFVDGNSRVSRLLMNWILWKKNYPPIIIPVEDLENYYDALDRFQIEENEKVFVEYIKKKYMKS